MSKTITLTVLGKELTFEPNLAAYNKLLNDTAKAHGKGLSVIAEDYLKKIIIKEHRDSLIDVIMQPGASMQIAGKVNDVYAPELDIEVKE